MRIISEHQIEQGASRYVVGQVEQFDQKNEMFKRPFWDPTMLDLGQRFYTDKVKPKDKPGYTLNDQAMVNASWLLENTFAQGVRGGRKGMYAWDWDGKFSFPRTPSGLKILDADPVAMTRQIKMVSTFFGASLVGICELDRRWLYSSAYFISPEGGQAVENEIPQDCKYAIAIAVEMDYEGIRCSPAHPASAATGLGYSKMAFIAGLTAKYIRGLGFQAIPCGNDTACSIPIAIDAGLGELGRNGLLITPQYGPRVRLNKVFTDLPLVPDSPIEFGVWDFCMICKKCAQKCPSQSLVHGDPNAKAHNISNREGIRAWHINAETCLPFWAANGTDCANCIRVCPFNKPPGLVHELVRWGISNASWLNKMFLLGDDIMGYGKMKKAKIFWDG
ncbi:MAG: reductive dehalogenase [Desulfobacterales bacterium]|nr:reductive dehalogenase [Deltaproteobacteria bacterium]NNL43476.1 reductive dehalogenase [Desulfobacterales bacterium]